MAQSIAAMWRAALNIETEIVIRNWDEYEAAIKYGDYDIVRRGMVMQSTSELVNLRMLFERDPRPFPSASPLAEASPSPQPTVPVESEVAGVERSEGSANLFCVVVLAGEAVRFAGSIQMYSTCRV